MDNSNFMNPINTSSFGYRYRIEQRMSSQYRTLEMSSNNQNKPMSLSTYKYVAADLINNVFSKLKLKVVNSNACGKGLINFKSTKSHDNRNRDKKGIPPEKNKLKQFNVVVEKYRSILDILRNEKRESKYLLNERIQAAVQR